MLSKLETARKRWGGKVKLIDKWLDNRQLLLIKYCELVKEDQSSQYQALPEMAELQSFCGKLVDYLSLGHFEVYESILSQYVKEGINEMPSDLLSDISETTTPCLNFSDRYMNLGEPDSKLEDAISNLGESLAKRFDLEDALIEELYRASQTNNNN